MGGFLFNTPKKYSRRVESTLSTVSQCQTLSFQEQYKGKKNILDYQIYYYLFLFFFSMGKIRICHLLFLYLWL